MSGEKTRDAERPRGRYRAEFVRVSEDDPEAQLQQALDVRAGTEWHLVGVAGTFGTGGVVLFWDTSRPSFGRTTP